MIYGMLLDRNTTFSALNEALAESSAVVLLGPRQVGKTTLARALADQEGALYLDLERAADRRRLDDAGAFLRAHSDRLLVIDEVHRAPKLFAELRGVIDERRRAGQRFKQFLLLGSASLELIQTSAETLAGRVTYLELNPINCQEAEAANVSVDTLWQRGGFPESLLASSDRASFKWRQNFVRSYLERDVPMFAPRISSAMISRLWTMLANDQGGILNLARLGQALGISAQTINRYIDLLVDLLLVRRLPAWSGNLNKRLVRSPRMYIRDSGLVHSLLEIEDGYQLQGHVAVGTSWEGFVIESIINAVAPRLKPYFFRTQDGAEIDLVLERAGKPFIAIEVKRSSAPKVQHGFYLACDQLNIMHRYVIAPVDEAYPIKGGVQVLGLGAALGAINSVTG